MKNLLQYSALLLLFLTFSHSSTMANDRVAKETTLSPFLDYQWKKRLLVFILAEDSATHEQSLTRRVRKLSKEFKERELYPLYIKPKTKPFALENVTSWADVSSDENHMLLIGKDAKVKFRGALDTGFKQIFALIDSMPMRQREMKEMMP